MSFHQRKVSLLKTTDLKTILITSPLNIYYYSGFTGTNAQLIITENENYIFTDSRYHIQAKQQAKDFVLIDTAEMTPSSFILKNSIEKIGFEDKEISYTFYKNLAEKLNKVDLIPISNEMEKNRQIKSREEIECIKTAARIADDAFTYILGEIREGVSEKEIAFLLEIHMRKNGAQKLSFETICASGVRSALPHGTATDKLLRRGDLITLDYGCIYRGYCSDMTRTLVLGKASGKQKEIYSLVLQAQEAALSAIKSNVNLADVDAIVRNMIKDGGYGENFKHGLGHSLGLNIHESPYLSPRSHDILQENMLMTVEPGIYIEGFGGVRIEDLVVVTSSGYENLTSSTKKLIELI